MALAPGSTIGRYRIESRIGAGAMGVVYLALDERLERRVALKLIEPSLAADPDFRARFEREARAAAALDHPHVLPVHEAGEDDGQLYLAMRYVPGVDLATHLARHGPLDLAATTRLVEQLAAALDAAHATGLIHRDVKPANVLLAPGEHAYLADFGLARSAGTGITRPGQLVGTADYTAPELLAGAAASAASDVYALACLAVECLTGNPPFSRGEEMATLYAHAHDPIPDLTAHLPELPAGLQQIVERGLAKEPADRYPTAGGLAAALEGAVGPGSLTADASRIRFDQAGRRKLKAGLAATDAGAVRPHRSIVIIGGILVLVVGGAALASQLGNPSVVTPSASEDHSPSLLPPLVSAPVDAEVLDEDQRANLAYIAPGRHEQCGPALPEDGPKFRNVGGLAHGAPAPIAFMATSGGIHCQFSRSTSGPSSVWMWRLSQTTNPSAPVNAREWMASHGGQVGASEGVCSSDEVPILETWAFSGRSGQLLCFTSVTGDAIVYWTYDGTNVLGKAIRDDRDMAVLLEWWRAEARLAGR